MNNPFIGLSYLIQGAKLLTQPSLRLFVIVPLLINLLIFSVLSYIAIDQFSLLLEQLLSYLPDWLVAISKWLLSIIFGVLLLITMGYTFTLVANLISAPFNGLLSEKIEENLTAQPIETESIIAMTKRTLVRELIKWRYFLPRTIGIGIICIVLFFIPPLNLFIPVIGFIWGSWCMAIQYIDYPMDNHQLSFNRLKSDVSERRLTSLGFGSIIMFASSIPVLNFFIMPIAIAGATIFWVEGQKNNS